jgi:uncharacterized membrane protein
MPSSIKRNYTPIIILSVITILSVAITFSYALTLRYELKTGASDGLSFAQTLFNLINGNGLVSTVPPPYIEQSWLGVHFSPILYALAPIYYLFPYVETLVFIHSLFIALAAIPIFFIARTILRSDWYALTISVFYLISPFVVNAQIWDFHEIAFAPLTISMVLWAVVNKNKIWLCIFCAILLTIKEHYGLAVFGTGLLWAWHWREPKFGITLSAFGLLSFFIVIKILMPHFNPLGIATMLNAKTELGFFSWLSSPFSDSGLLLKQIIDAIFYSILLLAGFWFQPILSIAWLLPSIADMTVNTLSTQHVMRAPYSYHSAAIIPVLLIAYVKTISRRYTRTTKIKTWEILAVTAVITVAFSYNFTALPRLPNNIFEFSAPHFSLTEKDEASLNSIIEIIGKTSPVAGQVNILPHIPVRRIMYIFPDKFTDVDYIIINTTILFKNRPSFFNRDYFNAIEEVMNDRNWEIALYQDNWLLFKRGNEGNHDLWESVKKDLNEIRIKTELLNKSLKP